MLTVLLVIIAIGLFTSIMLMSIMVVSASILSSTINQEEEKNEHYSRKSMVR